VSRDLIFTLKKQGIAYFLLRLIDVL